MMLLSYLSDFCNNDFWDNKEQYFKGSIPNIKFQNINLNKCSDNLQVSVFACSTSWFLGFTFMDVSILVFIKYLEMYP